MCLTKIRIFPKLSQIPIKTYKILDIGNLSKISNNFIFFTPFMYTKVELNSMLKAEKIDILEMFFFDFIGECGVHSYITLEDAKKHYDNYNQIIVECIIPPKTLYWEGKDFGDVASRKLYITNKIVYNKTFIKI